MQIKKCFSPPPPLLLSACAFSALSDHQLRGVCGIGSPPEPAVGDAVPMLRQMALSFAAPHVTAAVRGCQAGFSIQVDASSKVGSCGTD